MLTYCLITMLEDRLVGFEPIAASSDQSAIAVASGKLSERTSLAAPDLAFQGIRYVLEKGARDVSDPEQPTPDGVLGGWIFEQDESVLHLAWKPEGAD